MSNMININGFMWDKEMEWNDTSRLIDTLAFKGALRKYLSRDDEELKQEVFEQFYRFLDKLSNNGIMPFDEYSHFTRIWYALKY